MSWQAIKKVKMCVPWKLWKKRKKYREKFAKCGEPCLKKKAWKPLVGVYTYGGHPHTIVLRSSI